ncbi:MAG: DUF4173 domain-containing protein, partial [Clostridiales bacterium]|nr:DUF4173 domain-containing protein [Clostridiales bacterium]
TGICLGAFIFTAAAVTLGMIFIRMSGRMSAKAVIGGAVTVILILPAVFSANHDMRLLAGFSAFASYIVWITSAFGLMPKSDFGMAVSCLSGVFFRPFSRFGDVFRATSGGIRNGAGKKMLAAALGLVAAVPLTVVVLINLAMADRNFMDLFDRMTSSWSDALWADCISAVLGLLAAMYLFGLLSSSRLSFVREREAKHFVPAGFTLSLTIPLMICYILFFAVQIPYYLSAFGGVLPEGYSFSEYAVSGFFELIRVAVINATICLGVTVFADGKIIRRVTVTVLGAMTLILLATAASKLCLYIDTYSLTRKRVYAGIALVFIAAFFILMILRQYLDRLRLTACSLILCALFSVTMTFPDWDGIIAKSLLGRAVDGNQSDLTAIADLSNSPMVNECLIEVWHEGEWPVSRAAENSLSIRAKMYRIHDADPETPLETVLEFNAAEYRSRDILYSIYPQSDPTV